MAEFPITVTISRTPDPLVLSTGTGYFIARDGIGPGEMTWRRLTAESPFTNGRVLIHAVPDVTAVPMRVRVQGTSASDLHLKIQALLNAVSQFKYTVEVKIDNVVYTWTCEPADWNVGSDGAFQDLMLRAHTQYVSLSIPRRP